MDSAKVLGHGVVWGDSSCPTAISMVLLQTLWLTLVPSTASLWLSCTISQDLNPIQCRGSARKGNSLMQPTLTAPGEFQVQN